MKIDTGAFIKSLPIMGIGLLGIFIVTVVIILGIYILRALTHESPNPDQSGMMQTPKKESETADPILKKNQQWILWKNAKRKDFLETDNTLLYRKIYKNESPLRRT